MASKMSPQAEMKGFLVLASLNTIRKEELGPMLEKAKTFQPDQWYLVSEVREMLEAIVKWRASLESMFDLVSLGSSVTQTIPLPPDWTTLETALVNYGSYQKPHYRNTGLDWLIKTEVIDKKNLKVHFRMNFPDNFMYGWVVGFAKRLLPPNTSYKVYFDPEVIPADAGGDETIVWVSW